MKNFILLVIAFNFAIVTNYAQLTAQTNSLRITPNIILPKDSIESLALTASLEVFLNSAELPNEQNKYVFENQKIETFLLLDEIEGMGKSAKFQDDFFYKPYLTNVVSLNENNYLLQVSYIGIGESEAVLRASFEIIAHKTNSSFTFSSPLIRNTRNWKVKKAGNNVFHYQNTINENKIMAFEKLASSFDAKLNSTNKMVDYYCSENSIELQQLIGVAYKLDYNGRQESVWSSSIGDRKLIVLGNNNSSFDYFDTHDLFHDRLSLVISRREVNRAVDEGCAYLYGGSWGLSWKEIFEAFKEQIASNKNTDWAALKETPVYFKTKDYNNSADYIVNALLVQKIEKDNGFKGVWELLNVGPVEKGSQKYYEKLEELTGITKENYNDKVWELINNE